MLDTYLLLDLPETLFVDMWFLAGLSIVVINSVYHIRPTSTSIELEEVII